MNPRVRAQGACESLAPNIHRPAPRWEHYFSLYSHVALTPTPDALVQCTASTTICGSNDFNPDFAIYCVMSGKFLSLSVNLYLHLEEDNSSSSIFLIMSWKMKWDNAWEVLSTEPGCKEAFFKYYCYHYVWDLVPALMKFTVQWERQTVEILHLFTCKGGWRSGRTWVRKLLLKDE